ncbi:MAG: hypothetical protein OEZ09_06120 [Betaproteobacteria bacterium]|nr:hypothetical protein [Betaproteobacteria bacterium]MDH4322753.1 hypothetical protein [Betaproteobacteria bacterium]MDH5210269.1 hypothetical protein [Betaproteobacteria bacterium]MDH5578016.1 hypothetical protein [Betaproteobacteria bacterium]
MLALLVLVSAAADWHSRQVSLPRYCSEPEVALARLEALHSGEDRLLAESRRQYMVAAKLEFLVPRASGESAGAYRLRLRDELRKQCRDSGFLGLNSLIFKIS